MSDIVSGTLLKLSLINLHDSPWIGSISFFFMYLCMYLVAALHGLWDGPLGLESVPPALEAQSLNHWTAREVPEVSPFDKGGNQGSELSSVSWAVVS